MHVYVYAYVYVYVYVYIFQGNHGEDVKELYYYIDSTPTHSYMKALYKYPQDEYPYCHLERVNRERTVEEMEYELEDTGGCFTTVKSLI